MGSGNVKQRGQWCGSSLPPSDMGVPPPWAYIYMYSLIQ